MRAYLNARVFSGRFPQILAVFSGTISIIADGMQYGWSAPIISILESKETPVQIQKSDIVWLENIYMLGAFATLPLTIYLVDKIGRKYSMLLAAVQNVIGWILIGVASSVEVLYVGRFLTGQAGNVAFGATPIYIAEIADEKIRGFLSSFTYLMMLVGIMLVYAIGPFVSIAVSSGVGACFLVIQLLTFPFMPESPYYLLMKDKKDDARRSLQRFRCTQDVDKEFEEISAAIKRQQSEKGRPIDLVLVKSNRKSVVIISVLNTAQHFSSISVMLMNIHTILGDAASVLPSSTGALIFSVIMLVAAIFAACLVDRLGRKVLLAGSSLLSGLSLAALASYFAVKNSGTDISSYTWVPLVAVMVYAAAFKCGLGLVPSVLVGELFPTSVKAMGIAVGSGCYVFFAAVSVYLYQFLTDKYGIHVPFFMFAVSCLLTTLFVIFYIPETKGKTLEEIQLILKGSEDQSRRESKSTVNVFMGDVL